ncbi:hypothetical protein KC19_3G011200 [Ceratodon purpureus]|uniref:RING-type domain-containing protein n=1 Tax=Ceratodon purpureus TaxID=3225 RepID=A0A8T0IH02_CERPU|nr:hypothetical protein KC19_3G011200 [Ceratodon purpureus]
MSSSSTSVAPSSAPREQFRDTSSRHGAAGGSVHFHGSKDGETEIVAQEQIPKLNPFAKEFVPIPSVSESFFHVGDPVDQDVFSGNNNSRSGPGSGQKGTGSPNVNIKAGSSSKATASPARNGNGSSKSWQFSGAVGSTPPGGKKNQSLRANHLLNFQYDPIVRPPPRSHQPPSRRQRRAQPYNRELFLQANFRFLVSDLGDYVLNASDPDKMLQWEDVSAVNVTAPVPVQCPICLDTPPLCPQITSCGHIFCFPCILHYMMLGEQRGDPWKKCPLCFAMISVKEMRTVIISSVQQYRAGDIIKFNLLTRAKNSITPFEKCKGSLGALAYSEEGQFHHYSKFTLTSEAEHVTDRAVAELTAWASRAENHGGEDLDVVPYVYEAIDQLQQRKVAWTEHRTLDFLSSSPPVRQRIVSQPKAGFHKSPEDSLVQSLNSTDGGGVGVPEPVPVDVNLAKGALSKRQPGGSKETDIAAQTEAAMAKLKEEAGWVYESAFADDAFASDNLGKIIDPDAEKTAPYLDEYVAVEKEGDVGGPSDWEELVVGSPETKDPTAVVVDADKNQKETKKDQDESETYTFYQSADGQFLILHPLNMKALLQHYGDYKSLPSSIEAHIVELESVTQTEGTRKRYRYLSHLPLTASFQLCEVDLNEMLPAEAFTPFSEEIRTRQQRRRRLIQQEKVEKAKEERLAASMASSHPRAPSPADFAAYMASLRMEEPVSSDFELEDSATVLTASPPTDSRSSFSNVAKLGFASGYDAPQLAPVESVPSTPWGSSSAVPRQNSNVVAKPQSSGQGSSSLSFADIIQAQTPAKGTPEDGSVVGGKSGKKNKKGSMVLLSTAGGRRY